MVWTGAAKWGTQALRWASTLVIARLLTPEDYGLVGIATVYLGLVGLVSELGLAAAIVQHRDLSSRLVAQLAGLSIMLGAGLAALSAAAAPLIAMFFSAPSAAAVIAVLSAKFVLGGFQTVPRALLQRDLQYRQLAVIDVAESVTLALVTLGLAVAGFGYWALVGGSVAGAAVATLTSVRKMPHTVALPRQWKRLANSLRLGGSVVVSRVAWYSYSNADFVVVGRLLGSTVLGSYTFGWTLANIPIDQVTALVGSVTPAIFSSVQHDRPALRRYLLLLTEGLALVTFPLTIGLALVAGDFVSVVLGPQWSDAVLPLRILSLYAAVRSVAALFPQILVATGHAARNMRFSIYAAFILPFLFLLGARWGVAGVAGAWLVGYPFLVLPMFMYSALRVIDASVGQFARALWPAAGCTSVMVAAVLAVRLLLPEGVPAPFRLIALVAGGMVGYLAPLLLFHRQRLDVVRNLVLNRRLA
jgi:PST family polysaccharide transporter